ncbi:deoxyribonuclease-1-like [Ylistrum balloti]|uniref:deoxyribonuclease-1-like n=1 Tax=Ylistrum balloti TaxID=509963 RepID=UPI00290585EA|nr:deoxyribonuclease-1-like [Ylistrum balloti]
MANVISGKFIFITLVFLIHQFNGCFPMMLGRNLKISAFNMKMFGDKKMEQSGAIDILVKIITRYDITIVQEIRDVDGSSFKELMELINNTEYDSALSERLGRSHIKEEYGIIYRKDSVTLESTYQYPDPNYTFFERPPFAFKVRLAEADELYVLGIIAIHTKPRDAVREIDMLVDAYQKTSDHWNGLKNILIAGDFNAGCNYVTPSKMETILLRTDPRFTWLIVDQVDTTTSDTDCAYDRFVAAGDELKAAIVPGSARAFRFDQEYKLTENETKAVSDHYPIEMDIRGKVKQSELAKFHSELTMSFEDDTPHTKKQVRRITRSVDFKKYGFTISYEISSNTKTHVLASRDHLKKSDILNIVENLRKDSSPFIRESVFELIKLYLNSPFMEGVRGAHGFLVPYKLQSYNFVIACQWEGDCTCSFRLTRHIVKINSFT